MGDIECLQRSLSTFYSINKYEINKTVIVVNNENKENMDGIINLYKNNGNI